MIISDEHRLAFIHIPKCAGTSVSRQIGHLDSCAGAFRRKGVHAELGSIHYAHLPLAYLQRYYPAEFDKIAAYRAFALIRDPHARFASATFQRLEEFKGVPPLKITGRMALSEARSVIGWLRGRDRFCDLEHIHFSRQSDYVNLAGVRIVKNIFPLEQLSEFADALHEVCAIRLDPERRENANFASSNALLGLIRSTKPVYSKLTTWGLRRRILFLLQRWKLHTPAALYEAFRMDREINSFVETYYAEDFALRRAARAHVSAVRAVPARAAA